MTSQGYILTSVATPNQFLEDSPEATMVRQILGSVAQFQRSSATARLQGARQRAAEAKGKKSIITGKLKAQGKKSRLDGPDSALIRNALAPWLRKTGLETGNVKQMVEACDAAGIKSDAGTKLTHSTVKGWWAALKT